jgi:GR25 family glycosyltransferase involved in LPS biosynthesis
MQLPFEEIYLLNLVERPDKYETMRKRIDYMGWDVKDFRVVKHPISDMFVNLIDPNFDFFKMCSGNELNCAREQYTIIKSAYLRGVETVGIMEDDISFYKDMSVWDEHFNNLPSDWDILRINSLRGDNEYNLFKNCNDFWKKQEDIGLYGAGFYVMNRKAMKCIIEWMDGIYQPIDNILAFYIYNDINMYIPKTPLSLCLEDSFNSDIRGIIDETRVPESLHFKYKRIPTFERDDYI